MTQDTEDVVALIARLRFLGKTEPCRNIGAVHEAADLLQSLSDRIDDLELVADLALNWLGEQEPGDSRAVSNEVVAMAAIRCEQSNLEECRSIIRAALHREGIAP